MPTLTEAQRAKRNLNAHAAATFARIYWGKKYSEQRGGCMDFWDALTPSDKRICREAVVQIKGDVSAKRKKLYAALAFIARTVDTSQTCSKGNEQIAVVAMDALEM